MKTRRIVAGVVLGVGVMVACTSSPGGADDASLTPQEQLFRKECAACHGRDGNLAMDGAADLTKSDLNKDEIAVVIRNGKGAMPGFGQSLTDQEVDGLVEHVFGLREAH